MIYYVVVEEPEFSEQFDEISQKYPRALELRRAIDEHILRGANSFRQVENLPQFYVLSTDDWGILGWPVLDVVFYVNDGEKKVYLVSVRLAKDV